MLHLSFFGLAWIAFAIGVTAFVVSRQRSRRSVYIPPRQVIYPPVYPATVRSSSGGSVRRFILGPIIVLVVLAAAAKGLYLSRSADFQPATLTSEADFTRVHDIPIQPAQVIRPPQPPKSPSWWKKKTPPSTGSGSAWTGTIERSCLTTLADSREEMLTVIAMGLERQLNLRQAPSPTFLGNTAWVQIDELDRKPLQNQDDTVGDVVHINYRVELTPRGWTELAREQRLDLASERFEKALRGLGVLTVLLGAVAGYIRLDEWTKGYYSGRLILAATGLAVVLGTAMVVPW
jgi:hypothetical protein